MLSVRERSVVLILRRALTLVVVGWVLLTYLFTALAGWDVLQILRLPVREASEDAALVVAAILGGIVWFLYAALGLFVAYLVPEPRPLLTLLSGGLVQVPALWSPASGPPSDLGSPAAEDDV